MMLYAGEDEDKAAKKVADALGAAWGDGAAVEDVLQHLGLSAPPAVVRTLAAYTVDQWTAHLGSCAAAKRLCDDRPALIQALATQLHNELHKHVLGVDVDSAAAPP
jgi:hypothetical protein